MSWAATAYVKNLKRAPDGSPVTRSEKLLMMILSDYYNDEKGEAWPSVPRLASESQMSVRQAQRCIASLEKKCLLEVIRRPPRSSAYRFPGLLLDGDMVSPPTRAGDSRMSPDGDTVTPSTVTKCQGDGDIMMSPKHHEPINFNLLDNPHIKPAGVFSIHPIETCREYAQWLHATRQGITNPEGFAVSLWRTGFKDKEISAFLADLQTAERVSDSAPARSRCPSCLVERSEPCSEDRELCPLLPALFEVAG